MRRRNNQEEIRTHPLEAPGAASARAPWYEPCPAVAVGPPVVLGSDGREAPPPPPPPRAAAGTCTGTGSMGMHWTVGGTVKCETGQTKGEQEASHAVNNFLGPAAAAAQTAPSIYPTCDAIGFRLLRLLDSLFHTQYRGTTCTYQHQSSLPRGHGECGWSRMC